VVTSTGPTIEKLEALEELVVQKVTVSDILTYREGPITASWLIRGDGLISVPMSKSRIERRDERHRTAVVVLSAPQVLSARVDHERSMFWDAKQGFWNRVNPWGKSLDELQTHAMREAQRLVTHAVSSPEHLDQSRRHASELVQRLFAELGWAVTVEWTPAEPEKPPASSGGDPKAGEALDETTGLPGQFCSLNELTFLPG
jgi:hypothetical protein